MSYRTAKLVLPMLLAFGILARDGAAQVPGAPSPRPARTAARPVDAAAEEQAIRALSQQWLAAHRDRDVNKVMTYFADDAVTLYGPMRLVGRDAIRKGWEEQYAKAARERPDVTPSWQTTAVHVAQGGDMAYETGTYDDSWNGGREHERGHFVTIWRKVGGQWKVAHDMSIAVPDSAAGRRPTP
jgi:uncharacterized protein (TIGR02246 family)